MTPGFDGASIVNQNVDLINNAQLEARQPAYTEPHYYHIGDYNI